MQKNGNGMGTGLKVGLGLLGAALVGTGLALALKFSDKSMAKAFSKMEPFGGGKIEQRNQPMGAHGAYGEGM